MKTQQQTALLTFEDGTTFEGLVFANGNDAIGEVIFNTSMVGYQEILTDPSYKGQMVVLTSPMIGNYGIIDKDIESNCVQIKALLVKEYCDYPNNWEASQTLKSYLEAANVLGVEGLDTRAITKYIRKTGANKATLTRSESNHKLLTEEKDVLKAVSTPTIKHYPLKDKACFKVAVVDTGIKWNILRILQELNCEVVRFPYTITAEVLLSEGFDGVLLSNGPGDPRKAKNLVQMVQQLIGKIPIFGICMGHQILGMALGGTVEKLKFGHHGSNHPIKNLETGRVEITAQNHNYVLANDSFASKLVKVTHTNLLDDSIAGIRHLEHPIFSVQYHPEASPGPNDSAYLFQTFVSFMQTPTNQQ
ncbi:glutamine-hydrolyzing carbamoyl-phosphate synthase small subunit [Aureispira anguillae]|uniref:Carbamoyl phosphate synthase small chain n=1 Tax=Aureispira anguillae TaxID=2864201 RepID=A0A915YJ54_9BACT|nr:glutamine-hydrolyzing carbamoyl-phosphate synthase small subunit [Aureispira anguillae]BDS13921.1 glutamine-hydrolyzing carbamoyl-phosphate synthase small subunit [Aureispira anguillae]